MATLGSIAFPMFILHRSQALEKAFPPCAMVPGLICVELPLARHGPIGQIFYKKAPRSSCKRHDVCEASVVQWQVLAKRIWGAPMPTSFFPPQAQRQNPPCPNVLQSNLYCSSQGSTSLSAWV